MQGFGVKYARLVLKECMQDGEVQQAQRTYIFLVGLDEAGRRSFITLFTYPYLVRLYIYTAKNLVDSHKYVHAHFSISI